MAAVMALAFVWLPKNIAFAQVDLSAGAPTGIVTPGQTTATLPASIGNTVPTPTPASIQTTQQPVSTNNAFSCSVISNGLATCTIYLVAQAIVWILKLFISLGALLIQIGLQVNQNLFNAPIVTTGFSVSLSIANLGFVLGIIIIALATILRNQSYGAKQILWKLVVMAILINFGLVIARPIVTFADSLTNYFMGQISGASGSATAFTANLVNAFAPQTLNEPSIENPQQIAQDIACQAAGAGTIYGGAASSLCSFFTGIYKFATTNQSDTFVRIFLASIFAICLAALIAFVLIVLAVLLLVRYVYLGILLVLLPFAWLMWIFPKFSSEFHKWWSNFIKWTFFPSAALFFIYLVLATITSTAYQQSALQIASTQIQASQQAAGGIFTMTGLIGMIQQFADEFVLAGLLLGGLFAAQSLAGKAGGMVVEGGKSAVSWAGGKAGSFAGRQGKKAAARAMPEGVKQKLQGGGYRFLPKRLQVAAGIGMANVQKAGGSKLVDQESGWAKEQAKDVDAAGRMLGSGGLSEAKKFALLKAVNDNKKFDPTKITNVDGQDINAFVADDKRFNRYGQKGLQSDLQNTMKPGGKAAIQAANVVAAQGEDATMKDDENLMGRGAGTEVKAMDLLRKALDKNTANLDKDAIKKQNLSYMFGKGLKNPDGSESKQQALLLKEYLKAMMRNKPQFIQSMMPRLSQDGLEKMRELFGKGVVESAKEIQSSNMSNEDKIARVEQFQEKLATFEKAYKRISSGDWTALDEAEEKKAEEPKAPDTSGKK